MRTKAETQKRKKIVNSIIVIISLLIVGYIVKGLYDIKQVEKIEKAEKAYRISMRNKYSIINKKKVGTTVKISLDIQLNERLNKMELEELGNFIKKDEARYFKTAYIGFYLEELGFSNGYWATTHFTPNMEVWISNK